MSTFVALRLAASIIPWNFYSDEAHKFRGRFPTIRNEEDFSVQELEGQEHKSPYVIFQDYTLEQVEEAVKSLSAKSGGVTWYIAEVRSGFVAPPSAPTKISITEKGILPA